MSNKSVVRRRAEKFSFVFGVGMVFLAVFVAAIAGVTHAFTWAAQEFGEIGGISIVMITIVFAVALMHAILDEV